MASADDERIPGVLVTRTVTTFQRLRHGQLLLLRPGRRRSTPTALRGPGHARRAAARPAHPFLERDGGIDHVVNDTGAPVTADSPGPSDIVSYPLAAHAGGADLRPSCSVRRFVTGSLPEGPLSSLAFCQEAARGSREDTSCGVVRKLRPSTWAPTEPARRSCSSTCWPTRKTSLTAASGTSAAPNCSPAVGWGDVLRTEPDLMQEHLQSFRRNPWFRLFLASHENIVGHPFVA